MTQQRTWIAGAQGADDHVVQGRVIFEDTKIHVVAGRAGAGGFFPVDADFHAGRDCVGEDALLEFRIGPGFGNETRASRGPDLLCPLSKFTMVVRGEQAFFDREFADGNFEDFEVSDFLDHWRGRVLVQAVMVVVVVVIMIVRLWHAFSPAVWCDQLLMGSSQRSGNSVCSVSFSKG